MSFITFQYAGLLLAAVLAFRLTTGMARAWVAVAASAVFYASWDISLCMLMFSAAVFAWQSARDLRGEPSRMAWAGGVPAALMLAAGLLWPARTPQDHATWLVALAAAALLWLLPLVQRRLLRSRRARLGLGVGALLAMLGVFKYANFFTGSAMALLGADAQARDSLALNILLPVGISFYVFQKISYLVDCWRGEESDSPGLVEFCAYATYFPQLVAGPIERVRQLLPQLRQPAAMDAPLVAQALTLLAMGFFKKVFVADNCALVANYAFDSPHATGPAWLLLGSVAFAVQIYGDFSGYTDIARGSALLMGVRLSGNFAMPYLATSVIDFWHRWHITLSTWLRDYLYKPLGGARAGLARKYRNLLIVMALGGLWHGASWNFVLWGLYWGVALVINHAWRDHVAHRAASAGLAHRAASAGLAQPAASAGATQALRTLAQWALTMLLVLGGWVLFRATDLTLLAKFMSTGADHVAREWRGAAVWVLFHALPLALLHLLGRRERDESAGLWRHPLAGGVLLALAVWLTVGSDAAQSAFIYFQF